MNINACCGYSPFYPAQNKALDYTDIATERHD
jgi:hypothetical protein